MHLAYPHSQTCIYIHPQKIDLCTAKPKAMKTVPKRKKKKKIWQQCSRQ